MHIWHGVWGGPDVGLGTVRGGGHGCGLARMSGWHGCRAGTDVGLALGLSWPRMWARSHDAAALILG